MKETIYESNDFSELETYFIRNDTGKEVTFKQLADLYHEITTIVKAVDLGFNPPMALAYVMGTYKEIIERG